MQSISALPQGQTPAQLGEDVGQSGLGRVLLGVLETLERAGIPYCVLHGYESYPQRINSDVDCIISTKLRPLQLIALLHENRICIGAEVVHWQDYYIVLAGKSADGSPCFLNLDLDVAYELGGRQFYTGSEVVKSRGWHHQFWIPAPHIEFGCYLIKKIAKEYLDDEQGRRLSNLYQQDPTGCQHQVARFWNPGSAALIVFAASAGDWSPVRRVLGRLGAELRRRATLRHPWQALRNWACRLAGRVRKGCWPDAGLDIIFLGPDGAGKSSVIAAVRQKLGGVFARTACRRFPPGVLSRLLRRPEPLPEKRPHGSPPRSGLQSVIRAVCYWFAYYTLGYFVTVHLPLARGTLILHDRHLVDALVDPRRYRYGGPPWLLRLFWRLVPKPDLVILLDASPEVVQARKQEVPLEETVRQRAAYLSLVGSMSNGHVVDAVRPLEQVVGDVTDIILRYLTTRIVRRLG